MKNQATTQWLAEETSTHQDHVIAHVIGTSVLGYFVLDESLHIFLDIGFIWTIYLDGQMVLLPQTAFIQELEVDGETRTQLGHEIELLGRAGRGAKGLERLTPAPVDCLIKEVSVFSKDEQRRLILTGELSSLFVETSLVSGEIEVKSEV